MLVVGIIIAVLALLLSFSVTLYVSISDAVRIKVGMFGIKLDVKSPEHDLKAAAKEAEKLEKEEQNALKKKKKKGGGKGQFFRYGFSDLEFDQICLFAFVVCAAAYPADRCVP